MPNLVIKSKYNDNKENKYDQEQLSKDMGLNFGDLTKTKRFRSREHISI